MAAERKQAIPENREKHTGVMRPGPVLDQALHQGLHCALPSATHSFIPGTPTARPGRQSRHEALNPMSPQLDVSGDIQPLTS